MLNGCLVVLAGVHARAWRSGAGARSRAPPSLDLLMAVVRHWLPYLHWRGGPEARWSSDGYRLGCGWLINLLQTSPSESGGPGLGAGARETYVTVYTLS